MTERPGARLRRRGMKRLLLPLVVLATVLVGCGDDGDQDTTAAPSEAGTTAGELCAEASSAGTVQELGSVDVDGDGTWDPIDYAPNPTVGPDCPGGPRLTVDRAEAGALPVPFDTDLPVTRTSIRGIRVPGHTGDLVLVVQRHPRGGLSTHLSYLAGDQMRGVLGEDGALAPFVATDAPTAYLSARCTSTGFEVSQAVAHESAGTGVAWSVERTVVPGESFEDAVTENIAENLRQGQFERRFPELVRNSIFENCPNPATLGE